MKTLQGTYGFSISVIIPTHNRLAVLERAVESVLKQTFPVHELIVIDDGSTDNTSTWLAHQAPPVRYIRQSNHGVSHARNKGIKNASGDWIALLDSDDFWHSEKLAEQVHALTLQPHSRFCHCDELWVRNGKRINQKKKHAKRGGNIFDHCLPLCAISPSAAVMHRDIFTDHGLFDETLPACEDYDLWLRITAQEPVTFVDKPLLTKTGGHQDQLSRRFPVMDNYRLQSLAKLLRSNKLELNQWQLAHQMFVSKLRIVKTGASKHGNQTLLHQLDTDYADLDQHVSSG